MLLLFPDTAMKSFTLFFNTESESIIAEEIVRGMLFNDGAVSVGKIDSYEQDPLAETLLQHLA